MNELAVIEHQQPLAHLQPATLPVTAAQMRAQVNLIREVMDAVMKPDVHYGVIKGTDKPTLYKAGAEKIMATFRLAAEPFVEDLSGIDETGVPFIRYRVKVKMTSPTGVVVGFGIGECSSLEEKYKWRKAYKEDYNAAPEDRRRIKHYPDGSVKQIRTECADVANTVLKMAKKRSLVDGCLTSTAASDCFQQDIEDLPEELREEFLGDGTNSAPGAAAVSQPKSKSANGAPKAAQTKTTTAKPSGEPLTPGQIKMIGVKREAAGITEDELQKKFGELSNLDRSRANEVLAWITNPQ